MPEAAAEWVEICLGDHSWSFLAQRMLNENDYRAVMPGKTSPIIMSL
jgi:hypothetical protein